MYIPPEVDELTDEETFDDNQIAGNSDVENNDIAGTFELHLGGEPVDDGNDFDSSDEEPLSTKRAKIFHLQKPSSVQPTWKKGSVALNTQPESREQYAIEELITNLENKSPLEIFLLFFDDDIQDLIVEQSLKYAHENNRQNFNFTKNDLLKFIGILLLSGYHTLPQTPMYWSSEEDKGLDVVKNCMSRNRFQNIKRNLHLADNSALDKKDKFAKLRPFFDKVNVRFLQFGVFSFSLSIDEQMVPYFGKHSCKMFIRGKPVRFGFKLWCLCSADGYLYKFIPYAGAVGDGKKTKSALGMGGDTVMELLSILEERRHHQTFFDNFFSSFQLLAALRQKGFFATGTVRENRTNNCPLENTKEIGKKERGTYDSAHDENSGISLVRWNDNSVVTTISNHYNELPISTAKRYNRKEKKDMNINQPNIIRVYNKYMGGVDLHDNGVANYRITVRGKKWWWPLFTNAVDSMVVNSWKIYNTVNKQKMSQIDFKSYIALRLLKMHQNVPKPSSSAVPVELRFDGLGHVISKNENIRRRCKVCHSNTIHFCLRCNVNLHVKCFDNYHKE